jgi:hypothetical protein
VRTYRNHIVIASGRIRRQNDDPRRVTGRPFRTLAPAVLASRGYVRPEGDSIEFYGPDAQALLSDEFLDTHCLYVDPDAADRHTVGLAFEPVRRRGIVDIKGVLRFSRRTGELQEVEYEYTEPGGSARAMPAGGSVEFLRLASGGWVITRWHIRVTNIARGNDWARRGEQVQTVTDMHESGGEVTEVVLVPEPGAP